jgi:hypothetical protein
LVTTCSRLGAGKPQLSQKPHHSWPVAFM